MFPASTKTSSSNKTTVVFPDVCIVPAPPAPFVPTPYPDSQFQENMKAAFIGLPRTYSLVALITNLHYLNNEQSPILRYP